MSDEQEAREREMRDLKRRVRTLEKENAGLKARLANLTESAKFVEAAGVIWRYRPDGTYERFPYCPECKVPMTAIGSMLVCRKCNWEAPIGPNDIDHVRKELQEQ